MADQLFKQVVESVQDCADIIASTMGPMGRKVLIVTGGVPSFTRDGVTVCKNLTMSMPEGPKANGARLLYDVANRVVKQVGDGTTTVCVLVREGLSFIQNKEKEITPRYLLENKAIASEAIALFSRFSDAVDRKKLLSLAIAAANNNHSLGEMISSLVWGLGKDSHIIGKHSMNNKTFTDIQKGYLFNQGAYIPNFLGGRPAIALNNPYLLFLDEKVMDYKKIIPVYKAYQELSQQDPGPLVIIATDIDGEVLRFILANATREENPVPVYVVRCPSPENVDERIITLLDLQTSTGASTIFSPYSGARLDQFNKYAKTAFGRAESIHIGSSETRIVHGASANERLEDLLQAIKTDLQEATGKGDQERAEKLKGRMARLSAGIGVVYIGGSTESEISYMNDVVEDCVRACQSAMQAGVIIGAGYTYDLVADALEQTHGSNMISQMLKGVRKQMTLNAGIHCTNFRPGLATDIMTGEDVLIEQLNVYDPVDIPRVALDAAVSLIAEIAQTDNVIQV